MAAPTAPILGANGKLYRNTGSNDSPTWDLIPNVRDIEAPLEFSDIDVSSRLGGGFKQHEPGLGDIMLNLIMLYNPADLDMVALITAAWTRAETQLLILDAAYDNAGSQGIKAFFKIFKSGRKEGVDGIMEQAFDLKLCYSAYPPSYVTM